MCPLYNFMELPKNLNPKRIQHFWTRSNSCNYFPTVFVQFPIQICHVRQQRHNNMEKRRKITEKVDHVEPSNTTMLFTLKRLLGPVAQLSRWKCQPQQRYDDARTSKLTWRECVHVVISRNCQKIWTQSLSNTCEPGPTRATTLPLFSYSFPFKFVTHGNRETMTGRREWKSRRKCTRFSRMN